MTVARIVPPWITKLLPDETRSEYFESSLGRIHYLTRGRGRQIVFVHGNPTWSFLWRKVIGVLNSNAYEVVAPDLMNLGYSDDLPSDGFNMHNHVKYMVEFFRAKVRKGSVLVVQDWGGQLGLLAAQQCEDLFSGYVILNTGVSAPKMPLRLSRFHRLSNTPLLSDFVFRVLGFPMRSLHTIQHDKKSIRGSVARAYRAPITLRRRGSALIYARMVPSSEAHPSYKKFLELEQFCRNLHKPIEIVWGTKDPILGKNATRVRSIFQNAKFKEVDAGHFLQEEVPTEIAGCIDRLASALK